MMVSGNSMIALKADPHDPEDGDVTVGAVESALAERRERQRSRGAQVAPIKRQLTLRLDEDIITKFRATGRGWQSRMNDVLKAARP